MADWGLPLTTSDYITVVLPALNSKDEDAGTMFYTVPTNQPDHSIRWNRSTSRFQEWSTGGAIWTDLTVGTGLGLGSMSVQNSTAVSITGGTIAGVTLSGTMVGAYTMGGTGAWNAGRLIATSSNVIVPLQLFGSDSATSGIVASLYSNTSGRASAIQFSDAFTYNLILGANTVGGFSIWSGRSPGVAGTLIYSMGVNGGNTLFSPVTGTNAAYHQLSNTGGSLYVGIDTSAAATFGMGNYAAVFYSDVAPNISIAAVSAAATINFYTGGTTLRGYIAADGTFRFGLTQNFSWNAKAFTTIYQALSDGFVIAYITAAGAGRSMQGYTDAATPPTTQVSEQTISVGGDFVSMMFPVRKGDYYKVLLVGSGITGLIWWVPLGYNG